MAVEVKTNVDLNIQINFELYGNQSVWHRSQNKSDYDELWENLQKLLFIGEIYFDNCEEPGVIRLIQLANGIQSPYRTLKANEGILLNFPLKKIVVNESN